MKARRCAAVVAALALVAAVTTAERAQAQQPAPTFDWVQSLPLGSDTGPLTCAGVDLCFRGGSRPVFSTSPLSRGSFRHWRLRRGGPRTDETVCPSSQLCVGTNTSRPNFVNSDILVSRRPTSLPVRFTKVATVREGAYETDCAGPAFCATVGQVKSMFSRRPAVKGSWIAHGGAHGQQHVACASTGLCVAYDNDGSRELNTIVQPLERHSRWVRNPSAATAAEDAGYSQGACAGTSSCLVATSDGAILASADVGPRGGTWNRTVLYAQDSGVHFAQSPVCLSTTLCFALALNGAHGKVVSNDLLYSTDPFSGAPEAWHKVPVPVPSGQAVDYLNCPSAQLCVMEAFESTGDGPDDVGRSSVVGVNIGGLAAG